MMGREIFMLPINLSYTIDARFVKHAFMIHVSMLVMAMYTFFFWGGGVTQNTNDLLLRK